MDDIKKKTFFSAIERDTFTIGIKIPDTMVINDEEIPMRKIVDGVFKNDEIDATIDMTKQEFIQLLYEERQSIITDVENDAIDRSIQDITQKVQYIDRTIELLDGSSSEDISTQDVVSEKRWMEFVDKVSKSNL